MKNALLLTLICFVSACIPDNIKEKMNDGMHDAQLVMADWEFKKAIAQIELHKLRNGHYPDSLSELRFLSQIDSSMIGNVEYKRLDSVYELNLRMKFASFDGNESRVIDLNYPPEFWTGLGCVKSNLK